METKKSFTEASTSGSQEKLLETSMPIEIDSSVLTMLLETCMKLLCTSKVVKQLQELMNKCAGKENTPRGHCIARKIDKHKARTRCEMRLTAQIGDYEMDQVILHLGFDANVLPKQKWERMGRLVLQWSSIQLRMANQHKVIPMG